MGPADLVAAARAAIPETAALAETLTPMVITGPLALAVAVAVAQAAVTQQTPAAVAQVAPLAYSAKEVTVLAEPRQGAAAAEAPGALTVFQANLVALPERAVPERAKVVGPFRGRVATGAPAQSALSGPATPGNFHQPTRVTSDDYVHSTC